MSEIVIPMGEMKRMVAELDANVFESGDVVVVALGHHLLKAYKRRPARLFKKSTRMEAIGYSGVAHWWMRDFGGRQHSKAEA